MKAFLYKNIDLVRIPIKAGVAEYYMPQNVEWAGAKIDRIAVCAPDAACVDPLDSSISVLTKDDITALGGLYFNIYSADQQEILHAVSWEQLAHINNHPLCINGAIDLSLCNLYFKDEPTADATLLLYVYRDSKRVEDYDMPARSITFEFPLAANEEINLQQIIQTYIHALPATVKGIAFWDASAPAYLTLRDYKLTYVLQNLHSELARPMMQGASASETQLNGMLFDSININFQYSSIRNATASANTQKITLYY